MELPDLQPTRPTATVVADKHKDTFTIKLTVLLRFEANVLPPVEDRAVALRQSGRSGPTAGFGPVGDHELDLGVRPLVGAEVATFPRRVDRVHEVQVRRGHREIILADGEDFSW